MKGFFRNETMAGEGTISEQRVREVINSMDDGSDSESGSLEEEISSKLVGEAASDATTCMRLSSGDSNAGSDKDDNPRPARKSETALVKRIPEARLHSDSGSVSSRSTARSSNKMTPSTGDERRASRAKFTVLLLATATAAAVVYAIFHLASEQENIGYRSRFEDYSEQILEVVQIKLADTRDFYQSWSLHLTASIPSEPASNWPFVTIPNFEIQGEDALDKTGSRTVSICPIVSSNDRSEWEQYSVENQGWIGDEQSEEGISEFIFRPRYPPQNATAPLYEDIYLPVWQTAPVAGNERIVNYDLFNNPFVPKVFEEMMASREPVLSETVNAVPDPYGPPEALMAFPIFGSLLSTSPIVGALMVLSEWEEYLVSLVPEGTPPMVAVLRNPCTQAISYEIKGASATYLGLGDQHDPTYDSEEASMDLTVFESVEGCENSIHIYSTEEFYDAYVTNRPWIYAGIAVGLFLLTALSFQLYDKMMERQHKKVVKAANLSNALVRSLFPDNVRSRIIGEQSNQYDLSKKTRTKGSKDNNTIAKNSKPIADLFPHVTVMFADIAGFTAWSSSREPSQVFMLLETIYNSFDRIATRCKVFKVETIGDCYVAAAGLPDPNDAHAAVMARFAVLCMRRFREVVLGLEVTLGPETAELSLRAGLHSGPVTAGVLRGEKSRFQLFGDTVNTAARMEGTGASNQIHISQATADLVISECDELSVKPREKLMEVKGKGKMQTYWLVSENEPAPLDQGVEQSSSSQEEEEHSRGFAYTSFAGDGIMQTLQTNSALPASEKQKRLIDWNVDVLQGLLKKVVAMRSDESKKPTRKLAKLHIDREDGQMVIDEVKEVIDIRRTKYKRDPETLELGSVVTAQLRDYVTMVAQKYNLNHFHSFEHASHVTQSVVKLLGRIVAPEGIDYDNLTYRKKEDTVLHIYTYGITSDPLTQFAAAFSALIHDLDHKGVPNATLVKEETEEAKRYDNKSVAEQNSVDLAWELLMKPEYMDLRACIYNSRKEFGRFRQLVVNAVMATDIVDKELKALRNKRWDTAFNKKPSSSSSSSEVESGSSAELIEDEQQDGPLTASVEDMNRKATIVIEHLIQASDVSHTMQHWHIYQKWNQRFFFECYQGYLDGRSDVDPADGWYKGELGFFDFYIIPLAKKLKECGVFGVSSDEFLQYAQSNRAEWEAKGQDLVEQYIAAYKDHVFGAFRKNTNGGGPPGLPALPLPSLIEE